MILTDIKGEPNLPRYFAQAFEMTKKVNHGRLDFVLPDGRRFRAEGRKPGAVAEIAVHNPDCFARLIREGDLGFCDAYLEGWWSTPDLQAFMDFVHHDNEVIYDGFPGMGFVRAYERLRHWMNRNSRKQARRNISYHYDLGNEFYAMWLDDTMTYSSALFRTGQESLEKAQIAKYESMIDQMGVKPGDHVLEIGCGWGGFAEYAAKERGLRVTGLTISEEQLKFARERIEKEGISDLVEFKLQDYRDERGMYDGIASIEMFEAVGEKYWPAYFDTLRDRLRPGAQATLQIITIEDRRWDTYRKGVDFIQKYIFPGGMLPSPGALGKEIDRAGLRVANSLAFGQSYSQTLRRWHETFNAKWDQIADLGFDDRFRRMWNFYLTSCAGAFQSGNCDVVQITVTRPQKMPVTDRMPTAAKMAAAIVLAAVAWYASDLVRPLMPEGTDFGWFNYVNLALGLACGWFIVGTRVGRSYLESFSAGLTGMAALVFWALFLQSFNEMLKLALQRRYEGPVEGIVAVFEIAVDFGSSLLDANLIITLVVGGILSGVVAEWASRRWS